MRRVVCVMLLCLGAGLAGCAKAEWGKEGMSVAQVEAQKEGCWNYVLNDPEGRKRVKRYRALQVALGGPGMFLHFNQDDPKTELANIVFFNKCMEEQGYRLNAIKS